MEYVTFILLFITMEHLISLQTKNDIVIWDRIIRRKSDANLNIKGKSKYTLRDIARTLKCACFLKSQQLSLFSTEMSLRLDLPSNIMLCHTLAFSLMVRLGTQKSHYLSHPLYKYHLFVADQNT